MRILIADDHELLRDTLVLFLKGQGEFDVATAGTFAEACRAIEADEVYDLILLDLNMPGMDGLTGLKTALTLQGGQRVALMSGQASQEVVQAALAAGAAGFVPKSMPAKSLVNAVQFMAKGEQFAPINYATEQFGSTQHHLARDLTQRELQVLQCLTKGMSNKQIGLDLNIQETTAKLHVKTLYRKIGAANRTQAAMIAREAGLY